MSPPAQHDPAAGEEQHTGERGDRRSGHVVTGAAAEAGVDAAGRDAPAGDDALDATGLSLGGVVRLAEDVELAPLHDRATALLDTAGGEPDRALAHVPPVVAAALDEVASSTSFCPTSPTQ